MSQAVPKFEDALQQLVAAPSVSSTNKDIDQGNAKVITLLANWLQDQGFEINLQPIDSSGEKLNLYATIGQDLDPNQSGGLVFSGHADTVPCDPNLWDGEPFKLKKIEAGYQGLGATDMKGFFAVLLQSLSQIDLSKINKPLTIVATSDEETSMAGARMLDQDIIARCDKVIIGEPTDLRPIRMHKGILMEAIKIQGIGGHSSNPDLGINALEVMHDVLSGLFHLRSQLQKQYQYSGFTISVPTLNTGCIHGGDNPNRICSHCEIEFDLRTLPGMLNKDMRDRIDAMIEPIASKWNCSIARRSLMPGADSFEQSQASDLIATTEDLSKHLSSSVAFATEAPFYKALGLDTVVLGPGSIDQAHAINEYIPGEQVSKASQLYSALIQKYCLS